MVSPDIAEQLRHYAEYYENTSFLEGDPSWFMHQVKGAENQEFMAFLASCLSYGSRKQFMPVVDKLRQWSEGEVYEWVRVGEYRRHFSPDDKTCFYRLYSCQCMYLLLEACRQMVLRYGSLGTFVASHATTGITAVEALCGFFNQNGASAVVPKDVTSACKRICMFMRWMVRDSSPVDLGLWSGHIDKRTLIVPLDTHVLHQSLRLGLISAHTASMSTARRLTTVLAEVFPDDPLRGDFALFGYGVSGGN